jgi:outer membrane protein assembly factor BamD
MSCFEQLPNSIDRDLSLANETILNFSEIIKKYPGSSYVTEAKEKRSTVIRMLAQKEEYIADFYFKRNIYESALARYEGLYKNYSGLGFDEKALLRIVISAHKKADAAKAQKYFKILAQDFPGTPEFKLAEKELK